MAAKGAKGDAGRNELIRVGGTIGTLADIFQRDPATVKRVIAQQRIPSVISDDDQELYAIRDVAPYLIDISLVVNIEQVLKSTSLKKLPPELTKNYWDAYVTRKKALEDDKQLWRTEAVMEVFIDVFKVIRQSINQFVDTISDRTETTDTQRQMIVEMCDGLLQSTREKLVDQFELYRTSAAEKDIDDDIDD